MIANLKARLSRQPRDARDFAALDAVYEAMQRAEQPGDDQSPRLGRAEQTRHRLSLFEESGPLHAYRQIHRPVGELPRSLQPPLTRLWQKPTRNNLGIPPGRGGWLARLSRAAGWSLRQTFVASRFGHWLKPQRLARHRNRYGATRAVSKHGLEDPSILNGSDPSGLAKGSRSRKACGEQPRPARTARARATSRHSIRLCLVHLGRPAAHGRRGESTLAPPTFQAAPDACCYLLMLLAAV